MTYLESREARLVATHAVAFGVGTVSALIGAFTSHSQWLLVAGPCLIVSGLLIGVGSRITFAGPAGDLLRTVLGPARVRIINLRAIVWVLAGLLLCLWGFERLHQPEDEQLLQEPLAASAV